MSEKKNIELAYSGGHLYTSNIVMHIPMLRYLASRARFIIELGLETGEGSTLAFAEGFSINKDGIGWVGVDIDTSQLRIKPDIIEPRFSLVQGDTTKRETVEVVQEFMHKQMTGMADLIFIDTHHTEEQMSKELEIWPDLSSRDTTWVFHDTWMEGHYNTMTDVIKEFARERGLRYLDYSRENNGLGMVFK